MTDYETQRAELQKERDYLYRGLARSKRDSIDYFDYLDRLRSVDAKIIALSQAEIARLRGELESVSDLRDELLVLIGENIATIDVLADWAADEVGFLGDSNKDETILREDLCENKCPHWANKKHCNAAFTATNGSCKGQLVQEIAEQQVKENTHEEKV